MNENIKCEGVVVPMVTPFDVSGQIDLVAAKKITRHLINHGAIPFIMGTTGEASSIPRSCRAGFVKAVVDEAAGQAPIYVGIASNCMAESIEMGNEYHNMGADFAVAHVPAYYPLNPAQIENYYASLADAVPLPLLIYNILATTHISIPLEVIYRLSDHPNIVGLKDSEQDLDRQLAAIAFCKKKKGFSHLVGWGAQCANSVLNGSDGIVPSTGNITPSLYKKLFDAAKSGDAEEAEVYQNETNSISAIYQKGRILSEALPALKVMMHHVGLCQTFVLPPLQQVPVTEIRQILGQMAELNIEQKSEVFTN